MIRKALVFFVCANPSLYPNLVNENDGIENEGNRIEAYKTRQLREFASNTDAETYALEDLCRAPGVRFRLWHMVWTKRKLTTAPHSISCRTVMLKRDEISIPAETRPLVDFLLRMDKEGVT